MIILFTMKIICNILIYMIFINIMAPFLFSVEAFTLIPILVMTAILLLGYFLGNFEGKGQRLRFLAFLLLPLCFLSFEVDSWIFLLPPCGYLIINIGLKHFTFDFRKTRGQVLLCLKFVFLPVLFALFGGYEYLIEVNYFPYLFLFLGFSFSLLRMLLNDEGTISNPRFILYNLGVIGGIFTALLILGSPFVMRLVFHIGAWILRFILVPLVLILRALAILISNLFTVYEDREITFLEALGESRRPPGGFGDPDLWAGYFDGVPDPVLRLFIPLVAVFFLLLIRGIVRARRVRARNSDVNVNVVREQEAWVTEEGSPGQSRRFFAPKDDRLAIRFYYGRFLKMCKEKGNPPKKGDTTKEICLENKEVFSEATMGELRELYIKARYSHDEIEQGEGKRSGELLKQL